MGRRGGKRGRFGDTPSDAAKKGPKFVDEQPDLDQLDPDAVDQFHKARDEISLGKYTKAGRKSKEPTEVYAIRSDSEAEESASSESDSELGDMDSDLDDPRRKDDYLPSADAWGNRRAAFYSTDQVLDDHTGLGGKDVDAAEMEEEEAKRLQRELASQLTSDDFGMDLLQTEADGGPKARRKSKAREAAAPLAPDATPEERTAALVAAFPELPPLVEDYADKKRLVEEELEPVLALARSGALPWNAVLRAHQALREAVGNYLVSISFYLFLQQTRGLDGAAYIRRHPAIDRLMSWKQLVSKLEEKVAPHSTDWARLVDAVHDGSLPHLLDQLAPDVEAPTAERDPSAALEAAAPASDGGSSDSEASELGKRGITYEMEKNKGLRPLRKKEQRNPRVKHRNKFRKALIKKRSKVPDVRRDAFKYGGETRGIRAGLVRSQKFN